MEKKHFILLVAAMSTLFFSCKNDEEIYVQKVSFSFVSNTSAKNSNYQKSNSQSEIDAKYLIISIENEKGEKIYDTKKIELYQFNGSFISEPITLNVSTKGYKLTQFMVLDANNNVMYCTPLVNSDYAYLVNQPLPISFTVAKNQDTKITPEVISTSSAPASDYGYGTFNLNIIQTINLKTCVQITDTAENDKKLTNAEISVTTNDTVVQYNDSVNPVISTLKLKAGTADYTIIASKAGYETQRIKLSNAEIKSYSENPLVLFLRKKEKSVSSMAIVLTKTGTKMLYQFKSGAEYVPQLTINSVRIYDTHEKLKMTVDKSINQQFSIAALPVGYYILKVDVNNSALFSKIFYKD